MLMKFLFIKLLALDYARLYNLEELKFLKSFLINKSCLKAKYKYLYK